MSKFCQTETLPISFNQKKSISLALRQHQISLTQRNLMHIKREEVETEHWISTLTYGHPHIMYLTYLEGEPWVVVIKTYHATVQTQTTSTSFTTSKKY